MLKWGQVSFSREREGGRERGRVCSNIEGKGLGIWDFDNYNQALLEKWIWSVVLRDRL